MSTRLLLVHPSRHPGCCEQQPDASALADRAFLQDLQRLLRSHGDFLLAVSMVDRGRIEQTAANLLVWQHGRCITVRELVARCSAHRWNASIYEAWVWETAQRVRMLEFRLDATSAAALKVHAQHEGCYDISDDQMVQAVSEARRALYGDATLG